MRQALKASAGAEYANREKDRGSVGRGRMDGWMDGWMDAMRCDAWVPGWLALVLWTHVSSHMTGTVLDC